MSPAHAPTYASCADVPAVALQSACMCTNGERKQRGEGTALVAFSLVEREGPRVHHPHGVHLPSDHGAPQPYGPCDIGPPDRPNEPSVQCSGPQAVCSAGRKGVRIREEAIDRSVHAHHEHSAAAALGECSRWVGYQSAACLVGVLAIGRGHERHRVLVRLGASGSAAQRSIASPKAQRSAKAGAGAASGCRAAACASGASGILIIDRTFCAASGGACPAIRQGQDGPGCASEASADASLQLRSTARWRTRSAA